MTVATLDAPIRPKRRTKFPSFPDMIESIDGKPVEKKNMGAISSLNILNAIILIRQFAKEHKLGRVFEGHTGYRCFPDRPKMVRKPDASFVAESRLPDGKVPRGDFTIPPDLAVELISPHDRAEEVEEKVQLYLGAGVKLVWIVYPESRSVTVRRMDGTTTVLRHTDTLSGETVLPGFTCVVGELFV